MENLKKLNPLKHNKNLALLEPHIQTLFLLSYFGKRVDFSSNEKWVAENLLILV